jgi:hypothetical protein
MPAEKGPSSFHCSTTWSASSTRSLRSPKPTTCSPLALANVAPVSTTPVGFESLAVTSTMPGPTWSSRSAHERVGSVVFTSRDPSPRRTAVVAWNQVTGASANSP